MCCHNEYRHINLFQADILARIRHPNIIQFFGVSEGDLGFIIVTELAEGGSLYSYLHNPENPKIDFKQTITWALEIARGVRYLHYEAPVTIIHRDLKSGNIVLSGEGVCKLCDFGLSKILTHSCTPSSFVGTVPWMSPELITQENKISKAIDVWSYAVVLWEIISREVPYSGLGPFRIMELVTQKGSTLAIPASCPASFERLLRKCWRMNPEERCNMHQIIDALKDMQSSFMVF
ncbi:unnamed protein product [Anisakis simplex]|uniref:Protein kinase domain-containing protein n=1 Tax=Anisakis simplex TaxID=6269 RepID=A0A0M3K421_ANISI|nr:unnamed protein product [Anisakis simplex]